MKVLFRFKKNESLTPAISTDDINSHKYKDYGITEDDLASIFFKATKYLLEAEGIKASLK